MGRIVSIAFGNCHDLTATRMYWTSPTIATFMVSSAPSWNPPRSAWSCFVELPDTAIGFPGEGGRRHRQAGTQEQPQKCRRIGARVVYSHSVDQHCAPMPVENARQPRLQDRRNAQGA